VNPLISKPKGGLRGRLRVPGDKSISHRALLLGAVAVGRTAIRGLLESDDVLRTAGALGALGAEISRTDDGLWLVDGVGVGGLAEPDRVLDLGNSATGARLLMGLVATHPMTALFTGDESLRRRPMARVADPLERMGARVVARDGCRLPLALIGAPEPLPITYRLPVPSAQVKSAVLLAGLNAPGETTVIEPLATRDHTELMMRHFGVELRIEATNGTQGGAAKAITITGHAEITGRQVAVPGDASSAAFPAVAALLAPDSEVTIEGVGANPLRLGLYETLVEMGADLVFSKTREEGAEPVADITVKTSALRGVEVPAERAPTMIDEYPVLAVAAAFAEGDTTMRGIQELRVKESDRLRAIAEGLAACGVEVEEYEDGLTVHGCGGRPKGGATVATRMDHRIAMAFLVMGTAAGAPVRVDDGTMIATSFPGFAELLNDLGAGIAGCEDEA
jgi:3-phosphoshikimate 1-carboxyvinyltransferase